MLAIRADCNSVLGSYTLSGSQLTIELGPSTLVGCPPDSQADQFLAGLSQVSSYRFADGSLQLGLSTGGQMTFGRAAAQSLVGPTWELTGYNNGRNAVQSALAGTTSTATTISERSTRRDTRSSTSQPSSGPTIASSAGRLKPSANTDARWNRRCSGSDSWS